MSKVLLFLVLCVTISLVPSLGASMLGIGRWLVLNIGQCENPDQYENKLNMNRRKLNRTHDCFYGSMDLRKELNSTAAMEIDIYQLVDGGFKFFQTMADGCMCTYIKKHGGQNMHQFLSHCQIDPPDCPIPVGSYRLKDFVMDYRQLPVYGVYGTFEANAYMSLGGKRVSCIKITLNYDNRNDDEDDNDGSYSFF